MIHGIDHHGTFSRDPDYYRAIVPIGKARGHSYVLVTGIEDGDRYAAEVKRDVGDLMPIVFAAGAWKKDAALAAGFKVDVWEDDNPEYIAEQDPRRCVGMRAKDAPGIGGPHDLLFAAVVQDGDDGPALVERLSVESFGWPAEFDRSVIAFRKLSANARRLEAKRFLERRAGKAG